MSLAAAVLVGASAFAIDNVKVSGDAKLYYDTTDQQTTYANGTKSPSATLFDQDNSAGQAAVDLGITADLAAGISAGTKLTVLSTLGLENNLVGGVWAGNIYAQGTTAGNGLQGANGTAWWMSEAWLAGTYGKTTAKVGRMALDTPLAFTETWNIAANTFEAAVIINQDLPDTTLVGAYVGGSNGANGSTVQNAQDGNTPFRGYTSYNDGAVAVGAALGTAALDAVGGAGAYAAGIVNNSFKPLTAQAWYYDVTQVATAYWLQADLSMDGILAGAQYANMTLSDKVTSVGGPAVDVKSIVDANSDVFQMNTNAYAVMLGYALKDVVTVKAAYSSVNDKGVLNIQNTATGDQSKLYTEAWWNYGVVGAPGATTMMLNAAASVAGIDLFAQYTNASVDHKGNDKAATMDEIAVTATKSFGPLDTTLAYINTSAEGKDNSITGLVSANQKISGNRIQAYLTLNF